MDWVSEAKSLRKAIDAHLRPLGYRGRGNGWTMPGRIWTREFSFETERIRAGKARKLLVFPCLNRSKTLTLEEVSAEGRANLEGYVVNANYNVRFSPFQMIEYIVEQPEELAGLAAEIIETLDAVWLPWLDARDIDDDTSAYRYLEYVAR